MKEQWVLGVSIIAAAIIFGAFFYQSRVSESSVRVVGAATKRFDSDIVKWRVTLNRSVGLMEIQQGYQQVARDLETLKAVLAENGIAQDKINVQPASTQPRYNQGGGVSGYNVQQSLFVVSTEVATLEKLALNPSAVIEKGVTLQFANLEYYNANLSEIKRELLAEATKDARRRAEEIALNAGMSVKSITNARAGVFQITEPYSTEISDYGVFNASTKTKDITVTVNATFVMK